MEPSRSRCRFLLGIVCLLMLLSPTHSQEPAPRVHEFAAKEIPGFTLDSEYALPVNTDGLSLDFLYQAWTGYPKAGVSGSTQIRVYYGSFPSLDGVSQAWQYLCRDGHGPGDIPQPALELGDAFVLKYPSHFKILSGDLVVSVTCDHTASYEEFSDDERVAYLDGIRSQMESRIAELAPARLPPFEVEFKLSSVEPEVSIRGVAISAPFPFQYGWSINRADRIEHVISQESLTPKSGRFTVETPTLSAGEYNLLVSAWDRIGRVQSFGYKFAIEEQPSSGDVLRADDSIVIGKAPRAEKSEALGSFLYGNPTLALELIRRGAESYRGTTVLSTLVLFALGSPSGIRPAVANRKEEERVNGDEFWL